MNKMQQEEPSSLPPRSEVKERRRSRKQKKAFPLATILLVLFLVLVGFLIFIGLRLF